MQRCPTRVHASGLNQRSCVNQAFICQCFSRDGGESDCDARGEPGQGHPRVNWATRAPSVQSPPGIRPQAWLTRSLGVYSRFKVSAAREWAERESGRLEGRPDLVERCEDAGEINRYAARFLRRIRRVLAPTGRSSKAPAIIVVGSGTVLTTTLSSPIYF